MAKCRLFCLLARSSRRAVIFRRGPSQKVLMVAWTRGHARVSDRFEEGQWLNGRLYERRCDLSPSGEHLLYFAAQWRKPMRSWTAISKVPYFTALALLPKGDTYGGGGLFQGPRAVALSHPYSSPYTGPTLAPGFSLPRGFEVASLGLNSDAGEDFPLYGMRLEREGWSFTNSGRRFPWVLHKSQPTGRLVLEQRIVGVNERRGAGDWWMVEYALQLHDERVFELGRCDWADWDDCGDLLYARDGVLYRLRRRYLGAPDEAHAKTLIDLRDRGFETIAAPAHAKRW